MILWIMNKLDKEDTETAVYQSSLFNRKGFSASSTNKAASFNGS